METITINTDKMRYVADQLTGFSNEINNCNGELNEEISKLASLWSGVDATQYTTSFNNLLITNLRKLNDCIIDTYTSLNDIADLYDNLDEEFSSKNCSVF